MSRRRFRPVDLEPTGRRVQLGMGPSGGSHPVSGAAGVCELFCVMELPRFSGQVRTEEP